jgi:hypothetical protein
MTDGKVRGAYVIYHANHGGSKSMAYTQYVWCDTTIQCSGVIGYLVQKRLVTKMRTANWPLGHFPQFSTLCLHATLLLLLPASIRLPALVDASNDGT